MITRPSTEQILLDCRRELLETLAPELTSETAQLAVAMLENVVRNCATRAAHEIAWMTEETETMLSYAREVLTALPGAAAVTSAIEAYARGRSDSLHLDDVARTYALAGEAMSCAVDAAMAAGHPTLAPRAAELLTARVEREAEIMGEWGFVGRG